MQDLLSNIVAVIAYGVVALLVMVLSYVIVDLLTPGKLKELIWVQRAPARPRCSAPTCWPRRS